MNLLFLARIRENIRTAGWAWPFRALQYRALRHRRAVSDFIRSRVPARSYVSKNTLYAYYDLNVNPITYDVAWFCVSAELERRERGLDQLEFIVVPGEHDGFREEPKDYESVVDRDSRIWRLHNIILPCMAAMNPAPSVQIAPNPARLRSRDWQPESVFPAGYSVFKPTPFETEEYARATRRLGQHGLEVFYTGGVTGRRYVERWRRKYGTRDRLVVITLRQYGYMQERNANLPEWLEFARRLDRAKYSVVFVPDTDTAFDGYVDEMRKEFLVFSEAAFNIPLRAALYESAFVNMSTLAGPASIFMLNRNCRYLLFKMVVPSAPMSTELRLRLYGFVPGESPIYATPFQRLIWEADDADVLEREFRRFEALAEGESLPDTPDLARTGYGAKDRG